MELGKENLSLFKFVSRDRFTTWLEQEVLVPDIKPDVMKVIKVDAEPFIEGAVVTDGSIKLQGHVNYYIIYRSTDGSIKGITADYPYSQNIIASCAKANMLLDISVISRNIVYSLLNERKIMLKTELVFKYCLKSKEEINIPICLNNTEDVKMECKSVEGIYKNILNTKSEEIEINEDIILPEEIGNIEEIIKVKSKIINTDYKISYNKILLKGDLVLDIMYLKDAENMNNKIYTYTFTMPFTGMVEFENIAETCKFNIKYLIQSLSIYLSGTSINVKGKILASVIMCEEKAMSYIVDFYSTNKNVTYNTEKISVIKDVECFEKEINVKERIGTIDENSKIIDSDVDINNLEISIANQNAYIKGNVKVWVIYENASGKNIDSKIFDVPLDTSFVLGKNIPEENTDIMLHVTKKEIIQVLGNVEANIGITAGVCMDIVDDLSIIQNVTEDSSNAENLNSMYIYIVKKDDTLWNIAKKYKTTMEHIINVNNLNPDAKLETGQKLLLIR